MTELGPVTWPPAPIRTERLVLCESEAWDRAAVIEVERFQAYGAEQWFGLWLPVESKGLSDRFTGRGPSASRRDREVDGLLAEDQQWLI